MITLWLLIGIFFTSAAMAADTGLTCAIDMGSNNFRLIVGEMKGGKYLQHHFIKDRLGVGDDMSATGSITAAKLKQIDQTLRKYLAECDAKGITVRMAVATAAFREAKNSGEVAKIAESINLPLDIASEERESQLAYLVASLGKLNFAVIDNGSRSIELVTRTADGFQWDVFNLGYRIAFVQFFEPAKIFAEAEAGYRKALASYLSAAGYMKNRAAYMGVEMHDLARYLLGREQVDEAMVTLDLASKKLATLRSMSEAEFSELKKAKDIDQVLPRLVVLEQTLIAFGYREMQIFDRELGVGLIVEKGL